MPTWNRTATTVRTPRQYQMYTRSRAADPVDAPGLNEWGTPPWLFAVLAREFRFTLDVCASAANTMVPRNFITVREDAFSVDWARRARRGNRGDTGVAWCNPPYDSTLPDWMYKVHRESLHLKIVCLIPSRTGQRFWWDHVIRGQIRFLKSTLKYTRSGIEMKQAPFPSAVAIFGPGVRPSVKWWQPRQELAVCL